MKTRKLILLIFSGSLLFGTDSFFSSCGRKQVGCPNDFYNHPPTEGSNPNGKQPKKKPKMGVLPQ